MKKTLSVVSIVIFFSFQSCISIYRISNLTNSDTTITIGMKVNKEATADYYQKNIDHSKKLSIINKTFLIKDSTYLINYQIEISPHQKIKLSSLIVTKILQRSSSHDSMDIRLSSGQPIFVDSDSIKVNNFKLIILPWFQSLYRYTIK